MVELELVVVLLDEVVVLLDVVVVEDDVVEDDVVGVELVVLVVVVLGVAGAGAGGAGGAGGWIGDGLLAPEPVPGRVVAAARATGTRTAISCAACTGLGGVKSAPAITPTPRPAASIAVKAPAARAVGWAR